MIFLGGVFVLWIVAHISVKRTGLPCDKETVAVWACSVLQSYSYDSKSWHNVGETTLLLRHVHAFWNQLNSKLQRQTNTSLLFMLSSLTLWLTYAYLTYKDIYRIPALKDETVIVIKAPAETQLVVPHPHEVHVSRTRCNVIRVISVL